MTKAQLLEYWQHQHFDSKLLDVFTHIPRENFVPSHLKPLAYLDQPLPTARQQSISQPSTVMAMLQALDVQPGQSVFEVGAGAGYQAALLSLLVGKMGKVISLDVVPELITAAKDNLASLGLDNVIILEGDGAQGHHQLAPFDRIIITCACPTIPQPLIDQLSEGGIIVAPVGDLRSQMMVRGIKVNGKLDLDFLGTFMFVPMKGKYGFAEI